MVLAYRIGARAHRHNKIALHARMTSPAIELAPSIYTRCKGGVQENRAAVINFRDTAKEGASPREESRLRGEIPLWNYKSISFFRTRPAVPVALLSLTELLALRYATSIIRSRFYAARIVDEFLQDSYFILPFSATRVRVRYFLLSGSIFTVTPLLKAVPFTLARSIDDAKPIDDPRNRIFLSRLVRS